MLNYILAFVTGLTTGGLSCLAVQGGLLASSLAGQIEKDLQAAPPQGKRARNAAMQRSTQPDTRLARPILAFLLAKLLAYTLLGLLLGLVGQAFELSPVTRAVLQIAIGVFMLGSALRMLNVHPIFRYFAFEPPAFLRRKLRRMAANGVDEPNLTTPVFLGLLTVLIPCGITQAMLAAALGTADPLQGAALMFAFTLGTSPVFFAVAYFATQLGKRLEKHFMRFVAVVVLVLAVVTIDGGITLAGSPVSLTRLVSAALRPATQVAVPASSAVSAAPTLPVSPTLQTFNPSAAMPAQPPAEITDGSVVTITVEDYGYSPDVVHAKAGAPVTLRLVSKDVNSCSLAFVIPALNLQKLLQPTGETRIEIPAQQPGAQMPFACSMGMFTGTIVFDL